MPPVCIRCASGVPSAKGQRIRRLGPQGTRSLRARVLPNDTCLRLVRVPPVDGLISPDRVVFRRRLWKQPRPIPSLAGCGLRRPATTRCCLSALRPTGRGDSLRALYVLPMWTPHRYPGLPPPATTPLSSPWPREAKDARLDPGFPAPFLALHGQTHSLLDPDRVVSQPHHLADRVQEFELGIGYNAFESDQGASGSRPERGCFRGLINWLHRHNVIA